MNKVAVVETPENLPVALVTIDPQTYVTQAYESFQTRLAAAIESAKDVAYVITTKEGMEVAKANRALFRDIRIGSNKKREECKAPILEIGKLLDSRYKEIEAQVTPHESRFDTDIKAEEKRLDDEKAAKIKAEAERKSALQKKIDDIKSAPLTAINMSAADAIALRDLIAAIEPIEAEFGERFVEAEIVIAASISQLTQMIEGKRAQEVIAAQQEALRIENDRLASIAAAEKKSADEKARQEQAAEAERIKAERAAIDRERAELAAQKKAIDDHIAAEEAKARAKVEAEQRAAADAQAKIDESSRLVAEAEQRRASEERKAVLELTTKGIVAMQVIGSEAKVVDIAGTGKVDLVTISYPGDQSIIKMIQSAYGVSYGKACDWIIETAESLKVAA